MTRHHQAYQTFFDRHVGPTKEEVKEMLAAIGMHSLEDLVDQTIPASIRTEKDLEVGAAISEYAYWQQMQEVAAKNKVYRSYIGMGYYGTIVPPVIQRNILENPGWYTQYTPYQAEISQGRLEALLNFQTVVADLTGMAIANASLLDEGTAAAEAMQVAFRVRNKRVRDNSVNKLLVANACLETTVDVLQCRAEPLGIELQQQAFDEFVFDEAVFACVLQYPAHDGAVHDFRAAVEKAKAVGAFVIVIADLLSLTLLEAPGQWGADMVVGNTQRLGVPMGYGGPHAAYFAAREEFVRQMPGRVIGVSVDRHGEKALRMALQTREQHIRRDRATSNICTAQALLAIMAGMYAVYHGADGLKAIATRVHDLTRLLDKGLQQMGYQQCNTAYFDTLLVDLRTHTFTSGLRVRRVAELTADINFRYFEDTDFIGISLDETCTVADVEAIWEVFAEAAGEEAPRGLVLEERYQFSEDLLRATPYLQHPVFKDYRSETKMLRYIKQLEAKDLSLTHSMIPLGSCTMKLNATTELLALSFPAFSQLHPFVPADQAKGYQQIFEELEFWLSDITGFAACSLQPNSGAQGEYTGLLVIRAYHQHRGEGHRHIALIPQSAHGTNPASAVMAGMKVVVVKCDVDGNIDVNDLREKAEKYSDELAALMITYPSTHGVFEEAIQEVCTIIHQHGGQVYMDGANMNAQVGLTSPGLIGADVCHLNLHKTFSIPHGGGGPGMGPICVAAHLAPFLPGHRYKASQSATAIRSVASAPWGSASILLISHAYIQLLGSIGLREVSKYAILNANYMKHCLSGAYEVLYTGSNDTVAHELILDMRPFKKAAKIEVVDIAKRLMDYGFHAPTVSFPVAGTVMIEPTESESKAEMDRFCAAMLAIREEIRSIELGTAKEEDNVLKQAPHTLKELTANNWNHAYSREEAAYPLSWLYHHKFWASVGRVNDSHGDRNLMCTCPSIESWEEEAVNS